MCTNIRHTEYTHTHTHTHILRSNCVRQSYDIEAHCTFVWYQHASSITWVPVYIHTYIHTHIHMYIHTYTHTYMHIHIHTCIHIHIHTYTYIQTHTYIHMHLVLHGCHTHAWTVCMCMYTYVCVDYICLL
jgi:hypothetical protein